MLKNFFAALAAVKLEDAVTGLEDLAASVDPNAVAEAAIKQKMAEYDEVVTIVSKARTEYDRENAEYVKEQRLYDNRLAAAQHAQADLELNPNNLVASQALTELLDILEKTAPTLEKEKREAEEAKAYLTEVTSVSEEYAAELKNLRQKVDEQKRALNQATLEAERQGKRAESAAVLAGLQRSSNKFDTAMSALQRKVDSEKAKADAMKIKAEQLTTKPTKVSSAADSYLNATTPTQVLSVSERLAKLKQQS